MNDFRYEPPWADTSMIGIAGSSGSGKTSLALKIIRSLNLPWVIILSMVSICSGIRRNPMAYYIEGLILQSLNTGAKRHGISKRV